VPFPEKRIPVVMYHSINNPHPDWAWDSLSCTMDLFTKHIEALQARGFHAATLDDVVAMQTSGARPQDKPVVFTFDDGYLDNWVIVYPILKKLGWKGIVYVNPDFIDPGETPRPTLEDVWAGRIKESELKSWGFLNRAELRLMSESGILEIGSHSMTHTWYPIGPEIVDYHRPDNSTPWLAWNARPERKYAYLHEDQSEFVPWGTPIYASGRSLGIRRHFPDENHARILQDAVRKGGGEAFFARPDWLQQLKDVTSGLERVNGRYETDEEQVERYEYEINHSRRVLSRILDRDVRHFCWPGGSYNDDSWSVAEKSGYRSLIVKRADRNRWLSDDPRLIRRISSFSGYEFLNRHYATSDPGFLCDACEEELGLPGKRNRLRIRKFWRTIKKA
jgi:peptidoglycan/xylan/chitin deacetylase (PgdA/CDA1 family)